MKFHPKLTEQIIEELKKIPNIRQICKKYSINRSTFYRWMQLDDNFFRAVQDSLFWGRENINEMAEGVVINGVQNGSSKDSQYWLSHNHERYIAVDRVKHFEKLENNLIRTLTPDEKTKAEDKFSALIEYYYLYEKIHGVEKAKKEIEPFVDALDINDPDIKEIFYIQYERYKKERNDLAEKKMKMGPDHPHAKEHRDEEKRDREFDQKEKRGKK